jgi:membrane-bound lytic murein transglycosylase D
MSYTGRDYGLRIDWWVDDRRDPEASTKAALRYLGDLQRMFAGDWFLSWASYNGGQGRVMRATRAAGSTDFWTLARGSFLHSETDNYVPKLIAAAIIGKHPERYGFVGVKYQDAFAYDTVDVPGATGLDVIARCAGVKEEELLEYNPALRRWALPPDLEKWSVRLPPGTKDKFTVAFAKVPPEERVTLARHVVKRKETLASIAKKYGVDSGEIARLNHLSSKSRIKVGQELVVPARPGSTASVDVGPSGDAGSSGSSGSEASSTSKAKESASEGSSSRTVSSVARSSAVICATHRS